jgi:hypothetical protein
MRFAGRTLLAALLGLMAVALTPASRAADSCPGGKDLVLTRGKILTVDSADRTVTQVRIRDHRFLTVGVPVDPKAPCIQIVDLGGRTVIPGLLDNHTHFVRTAQAPGPFIEGLESADSIKALQTALATAAKKAEPGEWLAAIGGFTHLQFAEKRLPTREELTAAVPDHPARRIGRTSRLQSPSGAQANCLCACASNTIIATRAIRATFTRPPRASKMRRRDWAMTCTRPCASANK